MSVEIPYRRAMEFEYASVEVLAPGIRRVIAENPSPFTFHGTGTYILGEGRVAVVDPGPAMPEHIAALRAALAGEEIAQILVTHCHMDHSPGCALLREFTDAPTYAFGPHGSGRHADAVDDEVQIEESADTDFTPDVRVTHGEVIACDGFEVECVFTPGHTSNHMCYQLRGERALFTGDHVMGWSTSVISPPDGDMQDYMASLRLLLERDDAVYWPTHGPAITETKAHVEAFIAHREDRERQILECVGDGVSRIADMVPRMYAGLPEFMYPAAGRSVFASVIHLLQQSRLQTDGPVRADGVFRLP